jgi:hypothetical protein
VKQNAGPYTDCGPDPEAAFGWRLFSKQKSANAELQAIGLQNSM